MSVLHIPELASLVCQFTDRKSCARLLYVCRTSFHAAIPHVWDTVNGADKLLTLIPGTTLKYKQNILVAIALPKRPEFSRYWLYAPHVQCLYVYGTSQQYFQLFGWYNLITEFPLQFRLPKLQTLRIRSLDDTGVKDQLFWITSFANTSTREISIMPHDLNTGQFPWISWRSTSVILQIILDRCPNLQSLALFPCITAQNDSPTDKEFCLLFLMYKRPYGELLGCFQNLEFLSTTSAIIQHPALQALGQLPRLRTLCVSHSNDVVYDFDYGLGDASFPALERLVLRFKDVYEVEGVLKITPLIRRLTSLAMYFCSDEIMLDVEDEDGTEDEGSWTATHLLSHLEHAPNLGELTINFDMPNRREEMLEIREFSHIANRLVMLPIKRLTLESVKFALENFTEEGFDAAMWPRLTHLHIPDQDTPREVLLSLSGLPRLQSLFAKLHLTDIDDQMVMRGSFNHLLQSIAGSEGSTIEAAPNNLDHHVGFLLTLWPNLKDIEWPNTATEVEKMYIGCLNKHLTVVRQLRSIADADI